MRKDMHSSDHFTDLDGMRGVLAVAVMLHHNGINAIINQILGVGNANWGLCVDFFFVLSGFVLCKSICSHPVLPTSFAYKRFWRLFPLHLAILVLFSPILYSQESAWFDYPLDATTIGLIAGRETANGPAWSMAFEFYIPILLMALIPWSRLSKKTVLGGTGAVVLVHAIISYNQAALGIDAEELFTQTERHLRALFGLVLGFFLWRLFEVIGAPATRWDNVIFLGLSISFFILVILSAFQNLFAVLFPIHFAMCMYFGMRSRGLLSARPFQLLGKLSFGIYMVHVPVILLFFAIFGSEAMDGHIPLKLSAVALSILIACFLHFLIEVPGIRLGRKAASVMERPKQSYSAK